MSLLHLKYPILLSLFKCAVAVSQTCSISGFVFDAEGKPLPGAHVVLKNHNITTVTNNKGNFKFINLDTGSYQIKISAIGFENHETKLFAVSTQKNNLEIQLKPATEKLDEIVITGTSKASSIGESGYAAKGIGLNALQSAAYEADKLLARSSGVKIRQSGGTGSSMDISVNGLSGKMVKYFYDGIPIGSNYLSPLYTVPFNSLDYIEVYKGVIPSHLISDALGGAINLVSLRPDKNYIDVTAETGSYGLIRTFAGAQRKFSNGLFAGGYINYLKSDNNYPVDVEVSNPVTGRIKTDEVERFHDKFAVISGKAKIGWQNKERDNLIYTTFQLNMADKEIQHGILMENPAGEAFVHANTFENRIVFEKDSMLNGHMFLDITNSFNYSQIQYTDSTRNIYNWYGEITGQRITGNEIYHYDVPHNSLVKPINNHFKIAGKYLFNKGFEFHPTLLYSFYQRTGSDALAAAELGTDPYSAVPNTHKIASAFSLKKNFFSRFESVTGVKMHYFHASQSKTQINNNKIESSGFYPGIWQMLQFELLPWFHVFSSYEYAYRLPDENELFGNVVTTSPNTSLKPEKSHNLNAGLRFKPELNGIHFYLKGNAFLREIKDIIFLGFPVHGAHYSNVFSTRSYGTEFDLKIRYRQLTFSGNITWQELRNMSYYNYDGTPSVKYYNTRLPNIPWLFSRTGLNWQKRDLLFNNITTKVFADYYYTHSYYLRPEADGGGSSKYTIPDQSILNAGITEFFDKLNCSAGFEVHNVFDVKAYDHFKVQKPGRTYHLIIRYLIK